jgi:hypothetical protein
MNSVVQSREKENVRVGKQAGKRQTKAAVSQGQLMERQLESPLNGLINRREPMFLDELADIQLESPLNALINQRAPLTLSAQAAQTREYLLNAQMNQREQVCMDQLPQQLEPPINALINGHKQRRFWRTIHNSANS